ncbi:MAG: HD domain-containing protein [Solobacterium sp.]|nr:HD domain-containing protein [Solobacterium sp.]
MQYDLPDFLAEVSQAPSLRRLDHIDMNCGLIYTSLPLFSHLLPYSRYAHSLGVASLAWRFSGEKRIALAGLFHDIATPVFSHVVDFMHGDHENQEYTESRTETLIRSDEFILHCLKEQGITADEVTDYHRYPIADNDSPKLSCDRLEYTLQNMVRYGLEPEAFQSEVIDDLSVSWNEEGEEELVFEHFETAERFALASLSCGRIYSGKEDRYAMEKLARLLNKAVSPGILSEDMLYTREMDVIRVLDHSELSKEWRKYRRLSEVNVSCEEEGEDVFAVNAKKRFIDPFVKGAGRISLLSAKVKEEITAFLGEDYSVKLKGEFHG